MTAYRNMLAKVFGYSPQLLSIMEKTVTDSAKVDSIATANVAATEALDQASVLTLSPNAAFGNEYVLSLGTGLVGIVGPNSYVLRLADTVPTVEGGFPLLLSVVGQTNVVLPLTGQLATTGNTETLQRKTLAAPKLSGLSNAADDTAAATAGVPVGGIYRDGSTLKVRVA